MQLKAKSSSGVTVWHKISKVAVAACLSLPWNQWERYAIRHPREEDDAVKGTAHPAIRPQTATRALNAAGGWAVGTGQKVEMKVHRRLYNKSPRSAELLLPKSSYGLPPPLADDCFSWLSQGLNLGGRLSMEGREEVYR